MANTLTNIMPKILARGLASLRELCVMPRLVNSSYSRDAAQKGTTIDIPIPTAVSTISVSPSNTLIAPGDTTPDLVQVALDQWKQNTPFHLTDKELVDIDANRHFVPMQMGEAIKSLANTVNQYLHAQYQNATQGVYGYVGTAGTTPFGSGVLIQSATQARKVLNQQLCPRRDRRGVLNFDAGAAALEVAAFSDAEKVMSADVKVEGEIGRKFGIDWVEDDHVVTHTAGTISNGSTRTAKVNNGAGYAIGSTTINVDETTLTGTVLPGDIISFAGHTQTYCVIGSSAYTASGNAITGLQFYPGLVAAIADEEVMTVRASHVVNLVFHRDAFAFATRPLAATADQLGSRILTMQDAQTGLVLRLEVSRQHKQIVWEFDILYGAKLVRPQLAVRLAG